MSDVDYLALEDLLRSVRALGVGPVRDLGLLDAACARTRSTVFGTEAYPTLREKAAALLHSPARNHALVDGNKRLAWLATVVFLDLNGLRVVLDADSAFRLVVDVAEGHVEVDGIVERLTVG